MSLIFNKALERSDAGQAQIAAVNRDRSACYTLNRNLARMAGLEANAVADLSPRAWLDLDTQTVQLIGQEADVLFTDLNALSRPIGIGKLVAAYRRLGAMDQGETSLTGQITKLMGQVTPDYDGVAVPVHTKSFGLNWRELEGLRSIGADDVAENQAAAVREVTRLMTVNFMDGNPNINYQGVGAYGIRNNPNTLAVALAGDLTDDTLTYPQLQAIFTAFIYSVRGGTNRITAPVTVYISPEIEQNLQRTGGSSVEDRTFFNALLTTAGVAGIKTSYLLEGNEVLGIVLNRAYIQPVTAMPITTTPIPRNQPFADYQWITWSASGLQIKTDQDGRTGVVLGS